MFMVGALLRFGSIAAWVFHIIAYMGGCLGCDNKPNKLISSLNKPRGSWKTRNNQARQALSNPAATSTLFEDYYWTTGTCDMDYNSAMQSFGSISSTSTLTQLHDSANLINPSEFVNHGLLLWNQNRQKWIGNKKRETKAHQLREPTLSWNATYDSLLSSNTPFRKPYSTCGNGGLFG